MSNQYSITIAEFPEWPDHFEIEPAIASGLIDESVTPEVVELERNATEIRLSSVNLMEIERETDEAWADFDDYMGQIYPDDSRYEDRWEDQVDDYLDSESDEFSENFVRSSGATAVKGYLELPVIEGNHKSRKAKPKSFKKHVAYMSDKDDERKPADEFVLPSPEKLEALLQDGLSSGDYREFVTTIWAIIKGDEVLNPGLWLDEFLPMKVQVDEKASDALEANLLLFWVEFFPHEEYQQKFNETVEVVPEVEVDSASKPKLLIVDDLVHPQSAVNDRTEYLRRLKLRLAGKDGQKSWSDMVEKVEYREHRNRILRAKPGQVARIAEAFIKLKFEGIDLEIINEEVPTTKQAYTKRSARNQPGCTSRHNISTVGRSTRPRLASLAHKKPEIKHVMTPPPILF